MQAYRPVTMVEICVGRTHPQFSFLGSFSYGRVSLGGGDVSRLLVGLIGAGLG